MKRHFTLSADYPINTHHAYQHSHEFPETIPINIFTGSMLHLHWRRSVVKTPVIPCRNYVPLLALAPLGESIHIEWFLHVSHHQ